MHQRRSEKVRAPGGTVNASLAGLQSRYDHAGAKTDAVGEFRMVARACGACGAEQVQAIPTRTRAMCSRCGGPIE